MNLFTIAGLFCGVSCTILALIALIFGRTKIHRILVLFNICVAIWGFGYLIVGSASTETRALFGWRFSQVGGNFIAVFFYHITYLFCGFKRRAQLIFIYIWGLFFLYFCFFTNFLFARTQFVYDLYYNDATWLYKILMISWITVVCLSFIELVRLLPKTTGTKRTQNLYIIFGFLTGFIGGTSTLLPMIGLYVPPYGSFSIPAYCLIVTYAILRHQLLEIEVIVKKTLVFASLFAVVLGVFVGITVLTQEILAGGRLLGLAISSIIIILIVRPLENVLISVTDKFLFQKKYDYKQVLKSFIDEVITVLDLDIITNKTLELLDKMFHPERAALLLLDSIDDKYVSYGHSGYGKKIILGGTSRLPTYLKKRKKILSAEDINLVRANVGLKDEMDNIGTCLIIPLMIHDDLIGIMLLGKKKSDVPYSKDDLDILTDLAQTEATVVSNSRTHTLLLQAREKEQQTEHLVSLAFVVTNISHELRNPIQIISGAAETTLDAIDTELDMKPFDNKSKDTISYVKSKLKTIMEKSDKTNEMLNSILHSLKITPEKFTLVSIPAIAAEAIGRVEPYLEPVNIHVTHDVPDDFPRIRADRITLEQVFVNLLTNSIQAITVAKKGDRINITAFDIGNKIRIEISDNGPGIPEQDIKRIFEPFYTTKDNLYSYKSGKSKGAGLGLMIVHQTIARHDGAIYVRSKVGEGTTFVIDLPKRLEGV